nr:LysR substrate-binding domain-containing protein [Microvirga zambiensis]
MHRELGRLADSSLIARTIYEDKLITCASPAYLERHPAPVAPSQLLQGHQLVGYFSALRGEQRPMVFKKDGNVVEIDVPNVLANDSTGYVNMLRNGLGIGQTYLSPVKDLVASGRS